LELCKINKNVGFIGAP